jgi:hypothetical protein
MQAYGRSEFADRFAEAAADSSYSSYRKLKDASQEDIRAAAEALWDYAMRANIDLSRTELTEQIVIRAMLAQEKRWGDENELVSTEFEEYWDATDTHHFSPGLVRRIQEELARGFLAGKREKSIVVDNRYGIWLFSKATIWSDVSVSA